MPDIKMGCCVDKECNGSTCMKLRENETCGTCSNHARCQMLFDCAAERSYCDFFPRRYRSKDVSNG